MSIKRKPIGQQLVPAVKTNIYKTNNLEKMSNQRNSEIDDCKQLGKG